jgi:hypothetical protein
VQLIRLVVVAVACIAGVGGYLQEGRRLEAIRRLPGDKARDYYQAVRTRDDRVLWVLAVVFLAAALVAVFRVWVFPPTGGVAR